MRTLCQSTGAVLITFSIFLIILDSTWVWMDVVVRDSRWKCYNYDYYNKCYYFPKYTWTWGVGIFCGILGLTAGSLGVSVAKHKELVDFLSKFGPTGSSCLFFVKLIYIFNKLLWVMSLDHLLFCATGTLHGALEVIFIGWIMYGVTITATTGRL